MGLGSPRVDLYAPSASWQVSESFGGLTSGSHMIVVTVLGTKNASSTGTKIVVDAFIAHT